MQLMCQFLRLIRSGKAKPLQESKSALNILLCHEVSIEIVVDVLMPLIGTNHVIDFVLVLFCTAGPELSGAQHDLCPVVPHEFVIARHKPVLVDSVGDVCGDMQLDASIRDRNEFFRFGVDDHIRCRFFAIQRTFPRILCPFKAVLSCFFICGGKEVIAVEEQIACDLRVHVREVGEHVDLGVWEDVPMIAESS